MASLSSLISYSTQKLGWINKNALWLHIRHSENGVITKIAIEGVNEEQLERLQKMMYIFALGSAEPISKKQAFRAINAFSDKNFVTKGFAKPFLKDSNYNIEFIPCTSKKSERNLFFADHMFLAPYYKRRCIFLRYIMLQNY